MQQFSVLNLPVHIHNNYLNWLEQRLQQQQGTHVVTLNAEMAMQSRQNRELADVVGQAELVVPDGAGVVLFLRSQGQSVDRCPGIELAESIVQSSAQNQWQVFLIGGAEGVTETVAQKWQQKFEDLAIAGTHHGYFDTSGEQSLCDQLQASQPHLILVGLGVPRQELWIKQHRHLCPQSVWIGVGGSFDIWAGLKTRAPHWLRDNNLEWVYRLYKEPWRWRRMLALPHFVWCVTWDSLGQKLSKPQ
ncbi:WecB/TagA/CpsF family glycosyltransferase [Tumidithrix helvetica PCC 7403]|uniref:WecB/TagA/CpsF family glycosyltransferase n=1 Tax=Tumidithrix helvetica TaxID=3457545 RepID=UPI003CBFAEB8